MHKIAIAIWTADAIAILYGGYHYWAFYKKFEQARMEEKIPIDLQSQRMGIVWMIASPGVVPDGAFHRRKAMYGLGVFVTPSGFIQKLRRADAALRGGCRATRKWLAKL